MDGSRCKDIDSFEVVGFSHENKLLRSSFQIGSSCTRPCLRGADCIGMQKKIHGWENITKEGIVLTEYITPKEYEVLEKHGHYPKKRRLCVLCTRNMIFHCHSLLSQKPVIERNVLINTYANVCGAVDGYQEKYCVSSATVRSCEQSANQERSWDGIIGNVCMNHFNVYKFVKDQRNGEEEQVWYIDQSPMKFSGQGKNQTPAYPLGRLLTNILLTTQDEITTKLVLKDESIFHKSNISQLSLVEGQSRFKHAVTRLIILSKIKNSKLDTYMHGKIESFALQIIRSVLTKLQVNTKWIARYGDFAWYDFKVKCINSISNYTSKIKPISLKESPLENLVDHVFRKFFDTALNEKVISRNMKRIFAMHFESNQVFRDYLKIFLVSVCSCNKKHPTDWRFILNLSRFFDDNEKIKRVYDSILKNDNLLVFFIERILLNFFISRVEEIPCGFEDRVKRLIEDQYSFSKILKKKIASADTQHKILNIFVDFEVIPRDDFRIGHKRKNQLQDLRGMCKKLKVTCSKQLKNKSYQTGSATSVIVNMKNVALEGHLNTWSIEGAMKILKNKSFSQAIRELDKTSTQNMAFYFSRAVFFYDRVKVSLPFAIVELQTRAVENRFKHIPETHRSACIENACSLKICPNCLHFKSFVYNDVNDQIAVRHGMNSVKINGFDFDDTKCIQRTECDQYSLENFSLLHLNEAGYVWCGNGTSYMICPCCGRIVQSRFVKTINDPNNPFMCHFCIKDYHTQKNEPTNMSCAYCTREFKRKNSAVHTSCVLKDKSGQKKRFLFCTKKHFKKVFWDHPEWTIDRAINYIQKKNNIYK